MDLGSKKINVFLTGPQGVGKTHLLENYNLGKTIRIGDLSSTKRLLVGMLLHLFTGDKEDIAKTLYQNKLPHIAQMIFEVVQKERPENTDFNYSISGQMNDSMIVIKSCTLEKYRFVNKVEGEKIVLLK